LSENVQQHGAMRGLFATGELLVLFVSALMQRQMQGWVVL